MYFFARTSRFAIYTDPALKLDEVDANVAAERVVLQPWKSRICIEYIRPNACAPSYATSTMFLARIASASSVGGDLFCYRFALSISKVASPRMAACIWRGQNDTYRSRSIANRKQWWCEK